MAASPDLVVWDATSFVALFDKSHDNNFRADELAKMAESSAPLFKIITSALAVAEVGGKYKMPGDKKYRLLPLENVDAVWKSSVSATIPCNRAIMERAREILRSTTDHDNKPNLKGGDCVYIATAVVRKAIMIITEDKKMREWSLDSSVNGIRICTLEDMQMVYSPITGSQSSAPAR